MPALRLRAVSVALLAMLSLGTDAGGGETMPVEIRVHQGRPTVFIDGVPDALPAYSTMGWREEWFKPATPRFFPHKMGVYFICMPHTKDESDFWATPFWRGDEIADAPIAEANFSMDEQARIILAGDPGTRLIVRFGIYEPKSWRDLHPDELVVNEKGERMPIPSLASGLYWDAAARFSAATIRHCQGRPWGAKVVGFANFHRVEGCHEPLIERWLFDRGPAMTARWRRFLKEKYGTVEALRAAHGDGKATFEDIPVPTDRLRGPVPEVSKLLYWQAGADNRALRDYLELSRDLFHEGFRRIGRASREAAAGGRFIVYDALKQTMLGWDNWGFFKQDESWPLAFPDQMAGSGSAGVAHLFDAKGLDGLCTPHDYQARGIGGVCEPEGIVDSAVLRGKLFFSEMDTRTYTGHGEFGCARDDREFAAITWRNLATALARGFNSYWMDLCSDWFAGDAIHATIRRQVEVIRESANWPHETLPGIAMILDDSSVMETNGSGNYLNEAVLWEQKTGLARCGVPHRIYLFEDLELENFPPHRVYYFPNLFRADDARLALLRRKVFRDGNVVLWGPGSGISDGRKIGPESAARLTGFQFEFWPVNYPRRALFADFDHPVSRGLKADQTLGGPLPYGPMLFPKDGRSLALAWTKEGRNYSGFSVKDFGRGARGAAKAGERLGEGDWSSVFTTAVPVPADLWRNLARFAGAHVYCETNDVLAADRSIVALHSIQSGPKRLALPEESSVRDLISGAMVSERAREISFTIKAPETRVFLVRPAK